MCFGSSYQDEYLEVHNYRTSLHRYFGTTVMCYLRFVKGRTIKLELAASDNKTLQPLKYEQYVNGMDVMSNENYREHVFR